MPTHTFEGGYGRVGVITIKQGPVEHPETPRPADARKDWKPYPAYTEHFPCDVCHKYDKPVLSIDPSEEEYGAGRICLDCIVTMFHEFASE